jgi:hypothetical protein
VTAGGTTPVDATFVSTVAEEGLRRFFEYDTSLRGNGNGGHLYGTDLSRDEKRALLEFLRTLQRNPRSRAAARYPVRLLRERAIAPRRPPC